MGELKRFLTNSEISVKNIKNNIGILTKKIYKIVLK